METVNKIKDEDIRIFIGHSKDWKKDIIFSKEFFDRADIKYTITINEKNDITISSTE